MDTVIQEQKFFIDISGFIYCIDIMEMNADSWKDEIQAGWKEITKDEAIQIANPPPTAFELAESRRALLVAESSSIIAPMADAQAGGYIDKTDIPKLQSWQKYRYELTKVDIKNAPDIDWPEKPEE